MSRLHPEPPPPPPEHQVQCREPKADWDLKDPDPESDVYRRLWTIDMCANVAFNVAKRPLDQYPPGYAIPRRRWEFCSVRPIRGMGIAGDPHAEHWRGGEVCRHHNGRLVRSPAGRWQVAFCTRPGGRGTPPLYSLGRFFKEPEEPEEPVPDDRKTGIDPGRGGFVAGYQTPFWTELIVHSALRRCAPELA